MIDYGILNESVEYYELRNYKRIESPWTVTEQVSSITKPKGARDFKLVHDNGKCLVASGEQSFLYLYLKGFLPPGKFQTITPCFRHEDFDDLHSKYFMKNELIRTDKVDKRHLTEIIVDAACFFQHYLGPEVKAKRMSDGSYDLMFRGDELGSYGIRECSFLKWIYGTGIAEPRLSTIMRKHGIPQKRD